MNFELSAIGFNYFDRHDFEAIYQESCNYQSLQEIDQDFLIGSPNSSSSMKMEPSSNEDACQTKNSPEIDPSESEKKSRKSIHHNLQKHTVTTLKKSVSSRSLYRLGTESSELAIRMWDLFRESKEKTKEILFVLFGSYSASDEATVQKFKSNGLSEIVQKPEYLIRAAQEHLRTITIAELSSDNLDKHLEKRRMAHKEKFRLYLKSFCDELREGHLRQRLAKSKAKNIQAVLSTDRFLTF